MRSEAVQMLDQHFSVGEPEKIEHNYLPQQFADPEAIIEGIRAVVHRGDFTLGREVAEFEREFASMCGVDHAVGVGNGTDAIFLALKSLGLKPGQSVITTPYSFYATPAMIVAAGGTPIFVDVGRDFNINPWKIAAAIRPDTVGIVPVHWAGRPCEMTAIQEIAKRYALWVMEDCAHAPNSTYKGKKCGSFGEAASFSLHPLKNVNVWGDGGVIVTNDEERANTLRKMRNHGMVDRNTCEFWGYNSRLDTVQAVVAKNVLGRIKEITRRRRENAAYLDAELAKIPHIELPITGYQTEPNNYLYSFHARHRDALQKYLVANGIDAKVHYPVPLHLQPAAQSFGRFRKGDFPVAEWCADSTISLPVHEFITSDQIRRMVSVILEFYSN